MDRKVTRILAVACALCCLAALPLAASAATVYDGNISTTYITIFRDIVSKLPLTSDYVFFVPVNMSIFWLPEIWTITDPCLPDLI